MSAEPALSVALNVLSIAELALPVLSATLIAAPEVAPEATVGVPTFTSRFAESFIGTYIPRPVKVAVAYGINALTESACVAICVLPFISLYDTETFTGLGM